ncbi:choline/carnitine/betaine transport [Bowdeniella nasicola]|uniref:Choline/carnitine/betaine transport n=1 Tax=Bowdeniella nasicola TaxID=208480 RepID=A0A1H4BK63_9ACTO|nr:BCCT family transporter [Bowdeniella nasicola]SEA48553.1 choline/carnitine/betaine transport [Bowdeniella nasicola]
MNTNDQHSPQADVPPTATQTLAELIATHEELTHVDSGDDLRHKAEYHQGELDLRVIIPALVFVVGVVLWGLLASDNFANFAASAITFVVQDFGWAFVLFGTGIVAFIIWIAASKFGRIRLGRDSDVPEFSTVSWIAMMFAAGMGIGLMFYGTTEPLTFYREGVPNHEPHDVGASFATTLFHWTLHPWSIYAVVGLAIAYSTFRMGRKQLLSRAFIPLIGEKRADGPLGATIDVLTIVVTVFGTAASLGIGALQISAGLDRTGLIPGASMSTIIGIILVLTLAFLISAMSGVGRGIRILSNVNMILASLLAIFVFILGPSISILNMLPTSVANYLGQFFEMAGRTADSADGTAGEWLSGWTIFYWAWWISWSPFVGMFLARISRGRTIREFIVGVTLVPATVTTIWFSIFGGTAVDFEQAGKSIWGDGDSKRQLFDLLYQLPGGAIAAVVAMILLATFFITSADSASTVMASMSQNGRLIPSPWASAVWGSLTAAIGLTLLVSGGNDALDNLQSVTIIVASPFLIIIAALAVALVKGLANDPLYIDHKSQQEFAMKLARERRLLEEHRRRRKKGGARKREATR